MGILLQPGDFFKIGSCLVPPNRNSLWEAVSSPFASQTNLPPNPQICIWGWEGGGEDGFKTFSCAQRAYSLPVLISFWLVYHADLLGSVLIRFSENLVLVSAAVSIARSIRPNSPSPPASLCERDRRLFTNSIFSYTKGKSKRKYPQTHWQTPEHFERDETLCASEK